MGIRQLICGALAAASMTLLPSITWSADAPTTAADPELEARVNRLAAELRCLVCQNQSLADSHADLAIDLKNQVREQLQAGRSEQDVIRYMTERYGDFVLYRPPIKPTTVLLWLGPLVLLLIGGAALRYALVRQHRENGPSALTPEESQHVKDLLGTPRSE